jgi:prepilin peptidase CpaA
MIIYPCLANVVLVALLAGTTWHDIRRFRIPNALTYPALVCGVLLAATASIAVWYRPSVDPMVLSRVGLAGSLLGGLTGFALMVPIYALTRRGAGDVKLAAAIGALVGPWAVVHTVIWTHFAAALFAAGVLVWHVGLGRLACLGGRAVGHWVAPAYVLAPAGLPADILQRPIPLAGFFAIGSLLSLGGLS